jgi:hypothetical protein
MARSQVTVTRLPCGLLPLQNVRKYRTREKVGGIVHFSFHCKMFLGLHSLRAGRAPPVPDPEQPGAVLQAGGYRSHSLLAPGVRVIRADRNGPGTLGSTPTHGSIIPGGGGAPHEPFASPAPQTMYVSTRSEPTRNRWPSLRHSRL